MWYAASNRQKLLLVQRQWCWKDSTTPYITRTHDISELLMLWTYNMHMARGWGPVTLHGQSSLTIYSPQGIGQYKTALKWVLSSSHACLTRCLLFLPTYSLEEDIPRHLKRSPALQSQSRDLHHPTNPTSHSPAVLKLKEQKSTFPHTTSASCICVQSTA